MLQPKPKAVKKKLKKKKDDRDSFSISHLLLWDLAAPRLCQGTTKFPGGQALPRPLGRVKAAHLPGLLPECQRLGWADTTHQGLRSETFHLQLCLGKVLQPPWDSSFPIWKEKEIRASFQDPKEGLLTPWDPQSIVITVLFIPLPLVSGQTGRH